MLLICSYALSLYIVQQAAAPAARMIAADAATSAFFIRATDKSLLHGTHLCE